MTQRLKGENKTEAQRVSAEHMLIFFTPNTKFL